MHEKEKQLEVDWQEKEVHGHPLPAWEHAVVPPLACPRLVAMVTHPAMVEMFLVQVRSDH